MGKRRCISTILDLDIRWRYIIRFKTSPLYPREKATLPIKRLGGPHK
jgi:hypothetical protein